MQHVYGEDAYTNSSQPRRSEEGETVRHLRLHLPRSLGGSVHSTKQCLLLHTQYTVYTAHCTLHTAHCTLHTAPLHRCRLHTAHCTLHTAQMDFHCRSRGHKAKKDDGVPCKKYALSTAYRIMDILVAFEAIYLHCGDFVFIMLYYGLLKYILHTYVQSYIHF